VRPATQAYEQTETRTELVVRLQLGQIVVPIPAQSEVGDDAIRHAHAVFEIERVARTLRRHREIARQGIRTVEGCEQPEPSRRARVAVLGLEALGLETEASELAVVRLVPPALPDGDARELAIVVDESDQLGGICDVLAAARLKSRR